MPILGPFGTSDHPMIRNVIRVIVTHPAPHEDEEMAITCIRKDETGRFPGAAQASVVTVRDEKELEQYASRSDTLFIGVGARFRDQCKGRVFDDHGRGVKDKCATDLVAEELGLDKDPRFVQLLGDVRNHDLKRHQPPMSLAAVLKTVNEIKGEKVGIAWGLDATSVLYDSTISASAVTVRVDEFAEIVSEACAQIGRTSGMKSERFQLLLKWFEASGKTKVITDIGRIFSIMFAKPHPLDVEKAMRWLKCAAESIIRNQVEFLRAFDQFRGDRQEMQIQADFPILGNGHMAKSPIRVAFIGSDSCQFQKVFRAKDAGGCEILIQRNSRGQVCIFTDSALSRFDLSDLVRMLRWREIEKTTRQPSGWRDLGEPNALECAPEWFYFKEGNMILNGGKSNPNVRPTRLSNQEIAGIVALAFTQEGVEQFMREHGVGMSRMPVPRLQQVSVSDPRR